MSAPSPKDGSAGDGVRDTLLGPDEGLFETMRAEGGRVPLLDRHLARMRRSAEALGLDAVPGAGALGAEVAAALAGAGAGPHRVRLTALASGAVRVEVVPLDPDPDPTAITLPGWWDPGAAIREHKTTRYAHFRRAVEEARARGAGHALLLDAAGRPGEAATASLVLVVAGRAVTPPVQGILAGVARGVLVEAGLVGEELVGADALAEAEEVVAVNALRGAMPVLVVDGRPVGDARPGPVAARLRRALAEAA